MSRREKQVELFLRSILLELHRPSLHSCIFRLRLQTLFIANLLNIILVHAALETPVNITDMIENS
jgi:hypothetical protein